MRITIAIHLTQVKVKEVIGVDHAAGVVEMVHHVVQEEVRIVIMSRKISAIIILEETILIGRVEATVTVMKIGVARTEVTVGEIQEAAILVMKEVMVTAEAILQAAVIRSTLTNHQTPTPAGAVGTIATTVVITVGAVHKIILPVHLRAEEEDKIIRRSAGRFAC